MPRKKSDSKITRNAGSPKLFKSPRLSNGAIRSLNEFIKESRHPVFTVQSRDKKTGRKFGKSISFRETVDVWVEEIKGDCKGEPDKETCFSEWEKDLPDFCLMGNPRTCIKQRAFKIINEKYHFHDEVKSEIEKKIKSDKDWFESLSEEDLEEMLKNENKSRILEEIPF